MKNDHYVAHYTLYIINYTLKKTTTIHCTL